MTYINFIYWLRGYLELKDKRIRNLTRRQVEIVKEHLKMTKSEGEGNLSIYRPGASC